MKWKNIRRFSIRDIKYLVKVLLDGEYPVQILKKVNERSRQFIQ